MTLSSGTFIFRLRVILLSKLKKNTIFKYLKKNYFIYNYNFFHTFGAKSLAKSLTESLGKTLGRTVGKTFRAKKSRQESRRESRIGLYAWLPAGLSPRLVFLRGMFFYRIRGLVKNMNVSNMVIMSLLQVKKWYWGKLSQTSQGKLSASKYCEFSDENYK